MLEYLRLCVGERLDLTRVLGQLLQFGYRRAEQVADPGDLALHGGVFDVFPATFECPLRVELTGSRIASIRGFNPVSGETLERHSIAVILPRQVRSRPSLKCGHAPAAETPFEACLDLEEGDLVVHVDHGIGRYVGRALRSARHFLGRQPSGCRHFLASRDRAGSVASEDSAGSVGRTTRSTSEEAAEMLVVEYAGGDRLYMPLDQLHLLQTYVGFRGRVPALHTLGGTAWERAKTNAYIGAWTYAKEMISLQAKRLALPGRACGPDHEWQAPFERHFPYRETPDQLTAIEQVKRDMERPHPMDRLLLGDVGYGKTEVALRAAFKAVMDGRQVAVLVPTTILAYQHYRTLTKRMEHFPVVVEMLSRFASQAQQHRIITALREGGCDLVIGTHRLLSSDVQFRKLGLLIIDEEQRFGVRDKEQLKQWRTQLDVLTLSATPIPRTLYLAMMGARDLSLIITPPEHRHPVDTVVAEDEDEPMRRWIRRELGRQGQVYVVHHRVHTIHALAARVQHLVPEARVCIAHGQMPEEALEQAIMAFIEGRVDVLVTTTIIESGMDIPNANTLIISRADQFGLAELYQLRGRVGRFTRKAYAYLLVPKGTVLSGEARERLRALMQHTELGAGFHIAMEDLKIRGAGNVLGVEQHGHVTAVGFDLYCRLLREAIAHLRASPTSLASQPAEVT